MKKIRKDMLGFPAIRKERLSNYCTIDLRYMWIMAISFFRAIKIWLISDEAFLLFFGIITDIQQAG